MKVLVTGGAGFIGSHTTRKLVNSGHEVVVFDNLVYGHREFVPPKAVFIEGDLSDKELLEKVFSENKIDAVMHFAAYAFAGESVEKPEKYFTNNIVYGLNLLNVCAKNDVKKFIFSSSCSVYGTPDKLPVSEGEKKDPESPYGETKLIFEKFLKWYHKIHGLDFISLRYFNAAGADESLEIGEHHEPETHLIPLIFDVALGKRQNLRIYGTDYGTKDGTCVRDYIHVNDLADAHIVALENVKGKSSAYNLGIGRGYSVREIIKVCEEITGKKIAVKESERREGDPDALYSDSSKVKRELGWSPKYGIREIVETAWNWHKKRFAV